MTRAIGHRLAALEAAAKLNAVSLPRTPEQRRNGLQALYTLEGSVVAFHAGGWQGGEDPFAALERGLIALQPSYKRCLSWGAMQCLWRLYGRYGDGGLDLPLLQNAFELIGEDRVALWTGLSGILNRYPELDLTRDDRPPAVFFDMYADGVSANHSAKISAVPGSAGWAAVQPHQATHQNASGATL